MKSMTLLDAVLYAWTGLFLTCAVIGFPPLALLFLLYPAWHRRRVTHRRAHRLAGQRAAKIRWIERL